MRRDKVARRRTWAILVGIDRYRHLPELRNSVRDVQLVRQLLTEHFGILPKQLCTITDNDATRSQLLDALLNTIKGWRSRPDDQLLFFFAGHADVGLLHRRRAWYIAPVDARVHRGKPQWDTVISGAEIRQVEAIFGGAHVLYAFDACYAGMQAKAEAPSQSRVKSAYAIVAGRGDDPVLDDSGSGHSFFTESLASALQGWAPIETDDDAAFRASDLHTYLKNDVPRRLRKSRSRRVQYPFGIQLQTSEQGDEFALVPVQRRLPQATIQALFSPLVGVRRAAVTGMTALPPEYDQLKFAALQRVSTDESPTVRAEVAAQVAAFTNKASLELSATLLVDTDDLVCIAAAHSMSRFTGDLQPQAVDALRRAKLRKDGRVRREIQFGLAKLGDSQSVRAVIRDLPARAGSIRREIIGVLRHLVTGSVSEQELSDFVLSMLRSTDWRTRRAAAEASGELGLRSTVGALVRLATDRKQHFMVRYSATEALGHLGTDIAAAAVQTVLASDPSLFARTAAAEALGTLDAPGRSSTLRVALERDDEWRVRRAAAEACGFVQDARTLPSLVFASDDPHFRVRQAVAWALGELGGEDAERALNVLVRDRSSLVRRSAERSLGELRRT
jgi:HEAT repeat protein